MSKALKLIVNTTHKNLGHAVNLIVRLNGELLNWIPLKDSQTIVWELRDDYQPREGGGDRRAMTLRVSLCEEVVVKRYPFISPFDSVQEVGAHEQVSDAILTIIVEQDRIEVLSPDGSGKDLAMDYVVEQLTTKNQK